MPSPAEQPPGSRPWWREPLPPEDPEPEPLPVTWASDVAPWPGSEPGQLDDVRAAGSSPAGTAAPHPHPVPDAYPLPDTAATGPGDPALRSPYPGIAPQPAPHGNPERLLRRPSAPADETVVMQPVPDPTRELPAVPAAPDAFPSNEAAAPGHAHPGHAHPGYAQPGYGQPGHAQPEYAQPGYGQPGHAQPEYAQPEYAQPEYAQPGYPPPGHAPSGYGAPVDGPPNGDPDGSPGGGSGAGAAPSARSASAARPASAARSAVDGLLRRLNPPDGDRRSVLTTIGGAALVVLLVVVGAWLLVSRLHNQKPATGTAQTVAAIDLGTVQGSATSVQKKDGKITYDVGNTLDGDLSTAWNSDGAKDGRGPGITLTYRFAAPVDLRSITIRNGYQKTRTNGVDLWALNERVHQFQVITDTGQWTWDLADTRDPQTFTQNLGRTKVIRLKILQVYLSDKYRDVAISEIAFTGVS